MTTSYVSLARELRECREGLRPSPNEMQGGLKITAKFLVVWRKWITNQQSESEAGSLGLGITARVSMKFEEVGIEVVNPIRSFSSHDWTCSSLLRHRQ